ncbi:MAG: hypothetical protein ACREMT_06220, partial [Vulcanimicrobiaceae bacterium]
MRKFAIGEIVIIANVDNAEEVFGPALGSEVTVVGYEPAEGAEPRYCIESALLVEIVYAAYRRMPGML